VATRPPQAHHWLTVDFTDETENGWQKTQLRKLGRDFPKRSIIPLWGDAAVQRSRSRSRTKGPDAMLKW